eukprot:SAG31_NODE_2136_length_6360_cov_5.316882_7_plen_166_part_00
MSPLTHCKIYYRAVWRAGQADVNLHMLSLVLYPDIPRQTSRHGRSTRTIQHLHVPKLSGTCAECAQLASSVEGRLRVYPIAASRSTCTSTRIRLRVPPIVNSSAVLSLPLLAPLLPIFAQIPLFMYKIIAQRATPFGPVAQLVRGVLFSTSKYQFQYSRTCGLTT